MYKSSIFRISILLFTSLTSITAGGTPSRLLFWEDRMETALTRRNKVFRELLPESGDLDMTAWNSIVRRTVESVIFNRETFDNTWDPFIKGMLYYLQGNSAAETEFAKAFSAAGNDPGTTWLLFVEFDRYDLEQWVEKTLLQLEKQMFQEGGSSAVIVSRQLMQYGFVNKKRRSLEKARYYFTWAHRFNAHEVTSIIQRAIITPPLQFISVARTLSELIPPLRLSWRVQVNLFNLLYSLFRQALFLFILFVAVILSVKYFSIALHQGTHLYPGRVASSLRTILAFGVVISLSAFGIIPFLWFVAFFIWRFLSKNDRLLLQVALAGVVLSPLDSSVMDRINHTLNPAGPAMRLSQSIDEGPSQNITPVAASNEKTDLPLELSGAFDAVKSFDFEEANRRINQLIRLYPNDPVILNTKGIIYFLTGSIDSAAACFKKAIESNPADFTAQFNLSRCSVALNDATTGMDLLKKAAQIQPYVINRFVQDNDRCFSDQWPPLRQMLFPAYTPPQFWKKLFLPSVDQGSIRRSLWGASFFGIPPSASFFLFLLLFSVLIMAERFKTNQPKVRRLFNCKYCGKIICRRCSSGILCDSCTNKMQSLNMSITTEQKREQIISTYSLLRSLRAAWFNTVVPGTGNLLGKKTSYVSSITGIAISSIVYSYWYLLYNGFSFKWLTPAEIVYLVFWPVLFHLYAILRYAPSAVRQSNSLFHLSFGKERGTNGTQRDSA